MCVGLVVVDVVVRGDGEVGRILNASKRNQTAGDLAESKSYCTYAIRKLDTGLHHVHVHVVHPCWLPLSVMIIRLKVCV